MLRIWFGDRENAVYNTSVYFKNKYKDEWFEDDFVKNLVADVDLSSYHHFNFRVGLKQLFL